jgi:hypothetical protein
MTDQDCAAESQGDESPAARQATQEVPCRARETTKHSVKGVLRGFAWSGEDFRRV